MWDYFFCFTENRAYNYYFKSHLSVIIIIIAIINITIINSLFQFAIKVKYNIFPNITDWSPKNKLSYLKILNIKRLEKKKRSRTSDNKIDEFTEQP